MSRRHRHWRSDQQWFHQGGEWWSSPGEGREAWQTFGRSMAFKAAGFFFLVFILIVVGLGALVAAIFSNLGLPQGLLVVVLVPLLIAGTIGLIARNAVRSWRPVRDLVGAAGALADGDYSARVDSSGSPATAEVVHSFNTMAARLEASDRQRRQLLADLGHELRTPLTIIRGEIEAMLDGVHDLDPANLEPLMGEVQVMERLLEDLKTLSLLESGTLQLHPEATDISAVLTDVADVYRRRSELQQVTIKVEAEPHELVIDPVRIREVISNLVNNSLRAMPGGGSLSISSQPKETGTLITVSDTGVGIGPDEIDRVFDRFHKGSTSPGSGLGLTISRNLVEAHGGLIRIESREGSGTTVTIDLSNVRPGVTTVEA